MARPASERFKRLEGTDHPVIGRQVGRDGLVPILRVHMRQGRQRAERSGIGDQNVKLAPAFVNRRAQSINRAEIRQVERHKRRLAADLVDLVIHFFKPANRSGDQNDMCAFCRHAERNRATNAARCAGDDRQAILKTSVHVMTQAISASRDN